MTAICDQLDPSTRYVLPDDAPLLANLGSLWAVDPSLAAAIEARHPVEPYPMQASKAGPPTVSVEGESGKFIVLHSRYEPLAEAERLVAPIDFSKKVAFYVFGFGLGYHVEQLFRRAGEESLFCVFEPDLRLLLTAFS